MAEEGLPEEIVCEIVKRLGLRDLVRCTAVSKRMYATVVGSAKVAFKGKYGTEILVVPLCGDETHLIKRLSSDLDSFTLISTARSASGLYISFLDKFFEGIFQVLNLTTGKIDTLCIPGYDLSDVQEVSGAYVLSSSKGYRLLAVKNTLPVSLALYDSSTAKWEDKKRAVLELEGYASGKKIVTWNEHLWIATQVEEEVKLKLHVYDIEADKWSTFSGPADNQNMGSRVWLAVCQSGLYLVTSGKETVDVRKTELDSSSGVSFGPVYSWGLNGKEVEVVHSEREGKSLWISTVASRAEVESSREWLEFDSDGEGKSLWISTLTSQAEAREWLEFDCTKNAWLRGENVHWADILVEDFCRFC